MGIMNLPVFWAMRSCLVLAQGRPRNVHGESSCVSAITAMTFVLVLIALYDCKRGLVSVGPLFAQPDSGD